MKRALRLTGTVLALGWIGWLIVQQAPHLPVLDPSSVTLWAGVSLALCCYVISQFAAAEAWHRILLFWQVTIAPRRARSQPLVSQIGKYIPGNVAHLFGRLVIGRRDGLTTGVLAASMVFEIGFTLAAGFAVTAALLLVLPDTLPVLAQEFPRVGTWLNPPLIAGALIVAGALGAAVLKRRLRKLDIPHPGLRQLLGPFAFHVTTFPMLGLSLWATALAVSPDAAPGLVTCILVFAFAWVLGFVMPGAPGGIGVRDSIIVLGLAASVGEGSGLAIALLHRALSVLGDVAVFGLGWRMRHEKT
ncbi:hypothetical protein FIU94_18420 (plasmid) [Sulfitobacter sp. THAF37]|uniref:hypothetical protein n=1 Tax=Sulfitobacter sp. THAF37 TaxID=2587855 RepID=UPI001268583E|nr:hypothetical protein [Sulfitobacter sp. THAF37]QFT60814.1 hypothetical protein FIU94_18420 [Sulfitobacter sp. THAF37]